MSVISSNAIGSRHYTMQQFFHTTCVQYFIYTNALYPGREASGRRRLRSSVDVESLWTEHPVITCVTVRLLGHVSLVVEHHEYWRRPVDWSCDSGESVFDSYVVGCNQHSYFVDLISTCVVLYILYNLLLL